jgi:hypothetical protein
VKVLCARGDGFGHMRFAQVIENVTQCRVRFSDLPPCGKMSDHKLRELAALSVRQHIRLTPFRNPSLCCHQPARHWTVTTRYGKHSAEGQLPSLTSVLGTERVSYLPKSGTVIWLADAYFPLHTEQVVRSYTG